MNIMQVAGNVGAAPVTRFTASGQKVTTFSLATNKKKGENVVTTWYTITIWGDRFDKMLKFITTGSAVIIVGELQDPAIYKDKQGQDRIRLEIWADIIRFSPFGKPAEQRGDHPGDQPQRQSDPRFGEPRPQGDRHDSFAPAPSYEDEDEKLPF